MAIPSSTFTEIVSTTLRNHRNKIADNVSEHNALWRRLHKRGNVRRLSGGYEIVEPLEYAENSTYQRYSGLDVLNVGGSDVITAAKYDWKQAATNVVVSGLERRQNNSKEEIVNLVNARITNAMHTMSNNLSTDLYSDGTSTNQMGGIQHIVQDAGAGTVGGINSSTFSFWQNNFTEAAGTGTISKSTIKGEMNAAYLEVVRGADFPDLIVSSIDLYSMYWESLQDLQRYSDSDEAKAGFNTLKYVNSDVFHDTAASGIPTTHMYFLNTDYLKLAVHRDADMTQFDDKLPTQQDATVIPILFMGNLTCSNRSLQTVLIDAA